MTAVFVGGVNERRRLFVKIAGTAYDSGDFGAVDHVRQTVGAEQYIRVRFEHHGICVRLDCLVSSDGAGDDISLRRGLGLRTRYHADVDKVLDVRMIARYLLGGVF